jgi:type IV pilus assembly protein PilO
MPDLRQTRKNLTTAIAVMVGFDLLAAVLYFSPLIGSAESRRQDLNRLQADLAVKTREVAPLKDLPHKVVIANQEIADFYKKRFPSQNSQIYAEFGKLAAANGVRIEMVRYKPDTEGGTLEGLQAAEMDADLAGTYTSLARFINALERDEMFFIINTVTLGNDPRGPVKLSVRLDTYLKTGTT